MRSVRPGAAGGICPAEHRDQDQGNDDRRGRDNHGYRYAGARDEKLVCPEHFNKEAPRPVSCQVQQEQFSFKPRAVPHQEKQEQHQTVPQAFIQKSRMHLDKADAVLDHHIVPHFLCNFILSDGRYGKLHRKQVIRIPSKGFPVKEVPPASEDLADRDADDAGVQYSRKRDLLDPGQDQDRERAPDQASVDRKASASQIENGERVIRVFPPGKNHIIQPGPDDRRSQRDQGNVQVVIRTLSGFLCPEPHRPYPEEHAKDNRDPVKGDGKVPDEKLLSDMPQINAQMRKINLIIHSTSHVEAEQDHVAILDDVFLSLHPALSLLFCRGIGPAV